MKEEAHEKGEEHAPKKRFELGKHKSKLFVVLTLALLVALIMIINSGKTTPVDIDQGFSIYPEEYTKAVMFALYIDSDTNQSNIKGLFELGFMYDVPFTLFIDTDALDNLSEVLSYEHDIESAGHKDVLYKQMDYYRQERLIKQSKNLFKEQGFRVSGFLPSSFSYDYNTILAAENNNIRFIALPGNELWPYHPMSPLDMKMNILIFPLYQENDWATAGNGSFSILMNPDADLGEMESLFMEIKTPNTLLTTMQELNDYIRVTEKMEAEIVTDFKKLESYISFRNLVNDTKVEFRTVLEPRNITITNVSREWQGYEGGFYILLDEDDKRVNIEWEEPK